jgi:hypothetical protein
VAHEEAHAPIDESRHQQIQRAKMTILYIMSVSAAVVASLIYFGLH